MLQRLIGWLAEWVGVLAMVAGFALVVGALILERRERDAAMQECAGKGGMLIQSELGERVCVPQVRL